MGSFLSGLTQGLTPEPKGEAGGKTFDQEVQLLGIRDALENKKWFNRQRYSDERQDRKDRRTQFIENQKDLRKIQERKIKQATDYADAGMNAYERRVEQLREQYPNNPEIVKMLSRPTFREFQSLDFFNPLALGSSAHKRWINRFGLYSKAETGDEDRGYGEVVEKGKTKYFQEPNRGGLVIGRNAAGQALPNGGFMRSGLAADLADARSMMDRDKAIHGMVQQKDKLTNLATLGIAGFDEGGAPIYDESSPQAKLTKAAVDRYNQFQLFGGKKTSLLNYYEWVKDRNEGGEKTPLSVIKKNASKIKIIPKTNQKNVSKQKFTASWAKTETWKLSKNMDYADGKKRVVFGSAKGDIESYDSGYIEDIKIGDRNTVIAALLAEGRGTTPEIRRAMLAVMVNKTLDGTGYDVSKTINTVPNFVSSRISQRGSKELGQHKKAVKILENPTEDQSTLIDEIKKMLNVYERNPAAFMEDAGIGGSLNFYSTDLEEATVRGSGFVKSELSPQVQFARQKKSVARINEILKNQKQMIESGDFPAERLVQAAAKVQYLQDNKVYKELDTDEKRAEFIIEHHNKKVTAEQNRKDLVAKKAIAQTRNVKNGMMQTTVGGMDNIDNVLLPVRRNRETIAENITNSMTRKGFPEGVKATRFQIDKEELRDLEGVLKKLKGQTNENEFKTIRRKFLEEKKPHILGLIASLPKAEVLTPGSRVMIEDVTKMFPILSGDPQILKALNLAKNQQKASLEQLVKKKKAIVRKVTDADGREITTVDTITPPPPPDATKVNFKSESRLLPDFRGINRPYALHDLVTDSSKVFGGGTATLPRGMSGDEQVQMATWLKDARQKLNQFSSGDADVDGQDIANILYSETAEKYFPFLLKQDQLRGIGREIIYNQLRATAIETTVQGETHFSLAPKYLRDDNRNSEANKGLDQAIKEITQVLSTAPQALMSMENLQRAMDVTGATGFNLSDLPSQMQGVVKQAFNAWAVTKDGRYSNDLVQFKEEMKNSTNADDIELGETLELFMRQKGAFRTDPSATVVDRILNKIRSIGTGLAGHLKTASDGFLKSMSNRLTGNTHIVEKDTRFNDLERYRKKANTDLEAALKNQQLGAKERFKAIQAAQRTFYAISLTYQFAGMVQGGSGGRAISNEDFENLYRALWGNGGELTLGSIESAKMQLNNAIVRAKVEQAAAAYGVPMMQFAVNQVRKIQSAANPKLLQRFDNKLKKLLGLNPFISKQTRARHTRSLRSYLNLDRQTGLPDPLAAEQFRSVNSALKPQFEQLFSVALQGTYAREQDIPQKYLVDYNTLISDIQKKVIESEQEGARELAEGIPNKLQRMIFNSLENTPDLKTFSLGGDRIPVSEVLRQAFTEPADNESEEVRNNRKNFKSLAKGFIQDVINQYLYSRVIGSSGESE
tara:strand:+ start:2747 stop:6979 length:4233 start_codon:yes stop_codon:yes gene_type:complete